MADLKIKLTVFSIASIKDKIYDIVKKIPEGKVATYGEIARKLNVNVRVVGWMLHQNQDLQVPCHRVVDRNGRLAPNFAFDGKGEQRRRLEVEGVEFMDEMHVDLGKYLWLELI